MPAGDPRCCSPLATLVAAGAACTADAPCSLTTAFGQTGAGNEVVLESGT